MQVLYEHTTKGLYYTGEAPIYLTDDAARTLFATLSKDKLVEILIDGSAIVEIARIS